MSARHDVIVIGTGADAAAAARTLAAAGRRVTIVGDGTAPRELEVAPGVRVDALAGFGSGGGGATLCLAEDGPAVVIDGAVATPSLRAASPHDADRWPEFCRRAAAIVGVLAEAGRGPVPGIDASSVRDVLAALRLGRAFRRLGAADMIEALRVLPMSVSEWVGDWFGTPALAGALAFRGVTDTCLGPRGAGTAFVFLHQELMRAHRTADTPLPVTVAARVASIAMRGGRVTGVILEDGSALDATAVVSAASPRRTFLDLCDPTQLPPELVRDVRNIRCRGVTAYVHLVLDAVPAFRGAPDGPLPPTIVVAPGEAYVERAYDDAKYGRVSQRPPLEVTVRAAGGRTVLSVRVQYAPYRLRDAGDGAGKAPGIASWDDASRDALAQHVIRTLAAHAPELPGMVRATATITPRDLETRYGAPEGNLLHGELSLDQALFMRPVPSCATGRTPVDGLYLCGPGVHPAAGIPGQAGIHAATQILRDGRIGRSAP